MEYPGARLEMRNGKPSVGGTTVSSASRSRSFRTWVLVSMYALRYSILFEPGQAEISEPYRLVWLVSEQFRVPVLYEFREVWDAEWVTQPAAVFVVGRRPDCFADFSEGDRTKCVAVSAARQCDVRGRDLALDSAVAVDERHWVA